MTTAPFIRVTINDSEAPLDTVLLIGVAVASVYVFAAGNSPADDRLIEVLSASVRVATARLGEQGIEHQWTAIISYATDRIGGIEKTLSGDAMVGHMRLESTNVIFMEPNVSLMRSLSAWGMCSSVPIRVRGSSRGFNWEAANVEAARDLNTLCGIISVAWGAPIVVREASAPVEWGERQVPAYPPWFQGSDLQPPSSLESRSSEALPRWVDEAWARVHEKTFLIDALNACLEGMQLVGQHPSLAAVALTSSVETIAARLYKLPKCSQCPNRLGIASAFRETLRRVTDPETDKILEPVYSARSKTVHAGRFHGGETAPGVIFAPPWGVEPSRDFRWQILWRLQSTTVRLLKWALTNDLPPKMDLDLEES
jgi:hypothetical protein